MLAQEAKLHDSLRHKNIVILKCYHLLHTPQQPACLVMELAVGSLDELLQAWDEVEYEQQLTILLDVCSGLHYLHTQRLAHLGISLY